MLVHNNFVPAQIIASDDADETAGQSDSSSSDNGCVSDDASATAAVFLIGYKSGNPESESGQDTEKKTVSHSGVSPESNLSDLGGRDLFGSPRRLVGAVEGRVGLDVYHAEVTETSSIEQNDECGAALDGAVDLNQSGRCLSDPRGPHTAGRTERNGEAANKV